MPIRESHIAYVAARVRLLGGGEGLLLRVHEKWGDYSLLGGHVEPDEVDDWRLTALRETAEEMEPLRALVDFDVVSLPTRRSKWGPINSRSSGGAPTCYEAEWFALRFLTSPELLFPKVDVANFALLALDAIGSETPVGAISSIVFRLGELFPDGLASIPLAWPDPLDLPSLGIERLNQKTTASDSRRHSAGGDSTVPETPQRQARQSLSH